MHWWILQDNAFKDILNPSPGSRDNPDPCQVIVFIKFLNNNDYYFSLLLFLQVKQMEAKDKRIKLINEIFSGIKVHYLLKLIQNAGNLQFGNIIVDVRTTICC